MSRWEESITLYERGAALKARCEAKLKEAEEKVAQITLDANGQPTGEHCPGRRSLTGCSSRRSARHPGGHFRVSCRRTFPVSAGGSRGRGDALRHRWRQAPARVFLRWKPRRCSTWRRGAGAVFAARRPWNACHAYSPSSMTILPCMDDDDLRRGRPTVHVTWDEATAVSGGRRAAEPSPLNWLARSARAGATMRSAWRWWLPLPAHRARRGWCWVRRRISPRKPPLPP